MAGTDQKRLQTQGKPAIFLDRDGTIIEDVGTLREAGQIALFPDAIAALKKLQERFLLFVITNQGTAVQAGMQRKEVDAINRALDRILADEGIAIVEWYTCYHMRSEQCSCIKPNPFFIERAAGEYGIEPAASLIMGDHPHDVLTGKELGVQGLYLLTGHGLKHLSEVPYDIPVFHTLGEGAEWLLQHSAPGTSLSEMTAAGAAAIRNGELVAFPTETVYGLGTDALNADAAARIFIAKQRPLEDPLIVHIAEKGDIIPLVTHLPEKASLLIDRFWPGPLTLVLPKSPAVPDIITAGGATVAVRMPAHPVALALIRQAQRPVAAPSANLFGKTSPTTAAHVTEQLEGRYAVLIDGGASRVGVESTVLSLVEEIPVILRPGGVTREELEAVIGEVAVKSWSERPAVGERMASPGMLPAHYAPATPMVLVDDAATYADDPEAAIILRGPTTRHFAGSIFILGHGGTMAGAAAMLYQTLRLVDRMDFRLIVAERFPDSGIGAAVNDRLERAAAGTQD